MLTDYQTLVIDLVRDDAGKIVTAERDRAITAAVARYSKDRPRTKVEDVATTAANTLPLPPAWEPDFSALRSLEVPIGNVPPSFINQERYGFYDAPSGRTIQLLDALNVGTLVRAAYTIQHDLDVSNDTIPLADREPVACWAAAMLCDQLAAFYSGGTDSSIQADAVQNTSKAQDYAARGARLRKRYLDELGIDERRSVAAGTVVALEQPASTGGPRLTHEAGYRASRRV